MIKWKLRKTKALFNLKNITIYYISVDGIMAVEKRSILQTSALVILRRNHSRDSAEYTASFRADTEATNLLTFNSCVLPSAVHFVRPLVLEIYLNDFLSNINPAWNIQGAMYLRTLHIWLVYEPLTNSVTRSSSDAMDLVMAYLDMRLYFFGLASGQHLNVT